MVPSTDPEESTTATPDQIIAHRRRRLLKLADELDNVSEACRQMGVSRTRYYEWKKLAETYGLDALIPSLGAVRCWRTRPRRMWSTNC